MPLIQVPLSKVDSRVWSPQQEALFSEVEKETGPNILVEAVAGSGKTSSLVESVKRMIGTVAFCAYNRSIAADIESQVSGNSHVTAGTFHKFGLRAWKGIEPKSRVEGDKLKILQNQLNHPWPTRKFCAQLVSLMKQSIYNTDDLQAAHDLIEHFNLDLDLPKGISIDSGIDLAFQLLNASINERTFIDFDDMIYLPLVNKISFPKYDWVLIDEAQDSNPARRQMAKEMMKLTSRLIAVGDPYQAIYGFTGADNDALDIIQRDFGCIRMPLTVTYRCSKAVVKHAQEIVSHIQAAPTAPEGRVIKLNQLDEGDAPGEAVFSSQWLPDLCASDAILCRNTKPLISLAFQLIRRNKGCHVEGRDIGMGLVKLVKRFGTVSTVRDLRHELEDHLDIEYQRLLSKQKDQKAESLRDQIETILIILDQLAPTDPLYMVEPKILGLFGDTEPGKPSPSTTLSTIHKAKGREWPRVFLWGRNKFMPSKFAKQPWQLQQENNLIYVAITRAKETLIEVEV